MSPPRMSVISIHAAREGGDGTVIGSIRFNIISIHAAREGGDVVAVNDRRKNGISIHAAREGGDRIIYLLSPESDGFQSTPPVKAATDTGL